MSKLAKSFVIMLQYKAGGFYNSVMLFCTKQLFKSGSAVEGLNMENEYVIILLNMATRRASAKCKK